MWLKFKIQNYKNTLWLRDYLREEKQMDETGLGNEKQSYLLIFSILGLVRAIPTQTKQEAGSTSNKINKCEIDAQDRT